MTNKKIFKVVGYFRKTVIIRRKQKKEGKEVRKTIIQPFSLEIPGISEKDVLEKIYSNFGSRFKLKRSQIKIQSITEIPFEKVSDKSLQKLLVELGQLQNEYE